MKSRILLLFISTSLFSQVPIQNIGKYGIEKNEDLSHYQSYVGEKVIYLPYSEKDYYVNKAFKGNFDSEYIIQKIVPNSKKLNIFLKDIKNDKIIKMDVYLTDESLIDIYKPFYLTKNETVPLLFIDRLKNDKPNHIGKYIENQKVKSRNEIIDIVINYEQPKSIFGALLGFFPQVNYELKNTINNNRFKVSIVDTLEKSSEYDLKGIYSGTLVKVESPKVENDRYSGMKEVLIDGINKYNYIDKYIDILLYTSPKEINFLLKNISENSIKIIWDEAVIVNIEGRSSKVMHKGVKFSQRNEIQSNSIVLKGASLEDVVIPNDNIYFTDYESISNTWEVKPMYPLFRNNTEENLGEIKLMLPIQIKDEVNEYIFTFSINWRYDFPEIIK